MLESLLGSLCIECVLIFIHVRKEGYATETSRLFETDLSPIQNSLLKRDLGSVLISHIAGRTQLYTFNPSYPFLKELTGLLEKALSFYTGEELEKLVTDQAPAKAARQALLGSICEEPEYKLRRSSPANI